MSVLTVHVEGDVGAERADHIIVRRLAREYSVEVTSLEILQTQNVFNAAF
jgi:hypothetical protein